MKAPGLLWLGIILVDRSGGSFWWIVLRQLFFSGCCLVWKSFFENRSLAGIVLGGWEIVL
jgi:hypothetical protein